MKIASRVKWGVLVLTCCGILFPGKTPANDKAAQVETTTPENMAAAVLLGPEALYITNGELRAIPLQWEPVLTGAIAGYAVERAVSEDSTFEPIALVQGRFQTDFVDQGHQSGILLGGAKDGIMGDGAKFWYRVCPFDTERRISQHCSPTQPGQTAEAPKPPPGIQAYSRLPRQVFLRWRPSPDPTTASYAIERSPSQNGDFDRIATLDGRFSTSYLDRNLGDLRVFYYRILSINRAGGEGPPSEALRSVTKPEPLPPIGLSLLESRLGSIRLGWEPNVEPDIASYRLFRQLEGGGEQTSIGEYPADASEAIDPDVPPGAALSYALVAIDRDQLESAQSKRLRFTSEGYSLKAEMDGKAVVLHWKQRSDEGFTGAKVLRASGFFTRSEGSEIAHLLDARGVLRDETVTPGKHYVYRVILEGADGKLAPVSKSVEIAVPPLPKP